MLSKNNFLKKRNTAPAIRVKHIEGNMSVRLISLNKPHLMLPVCSFFLEALRVLLPATAVLYYMNIFTLPSKSLAATHAS